MRHLTRFCSGTFLCLLMIAESSGATTIEAGEATASWNGTGVIEDLENGDRLFSGSITGTMFIRHPEGTAHARIHADKTIARPWSVSARARKSGRMPSAS